MGKDMRRGVSMLMNMLLVLAFLQAPFQHTHHHDCPRWHPHGLFHIHTIPFMSPAPVQPKSGTVIPTMTLSFGSGMQLLPVRSLA